MSETHEEYRKRLQGMSNDALRAEFSDGRRAISTRIDVAAKMTESLSSDLDKYKSSRGDEADERWRRIEKGAEIVSGISADIDDRDKRFLAVVDEMNSSKRELLGMDDGGVYGEFEGQDNHPGFSANKDKLKIDSVLKEIRTEAEGRDRNRDRERLSNMSDADLIKDYSRERENALDSGKKAKTEALAVSDRLPSRDTNGWTEFKKLGDQAVSHDKEADRAYGRVRDMVDEMKSRDGLKIENDETRRNFEIDKKFGFKRDETEALRTKTRLDRFTTHSEMQDKVFEFQKSQERDSTVSQSQTDDRRPNLTQSDPDRGQKRDDAEFLGREAAHILPQGERDRQRDAARFQNPEEKRGLEQELKPEMSLGGASEPQAAQAKGAEREKAPAQAEQKAETKAPVSALGKAAAYFDRKRDEAAKPAEQKQADQKGEQKAETKKPLSVLGRAAAYFDRKQAEQPKPAEEQSRRM